MRKLIVTAMVAGIATAVPLWSGVEEAAAAQPAAVPSDVAVATAVAQARLGFRLLRDLANGNPSPAAVLNSPAGVAAAFAFLDLAADAGMHRALVKTLGFDPQQGSNALEGLRRAGKEFAATPPGSGALEFASGIFFDPAGKVRATALERLKDAGVDAREAALDTQSGIAEVNAWVAEHTAGLIPSILETPLSNPVLVALNALYFKDKWLEPFDPALTRPEPFRLVGSDTADVTMMHLSTSGLAVRQDDGFVGVNLPYQTAGLNLTVVTTKKEPATIADFGPVADWLDGSDFQAESNDVDLSLPKFDAGMSAELLPALKRIGLAEGFSPTAFEGLSEKRLVISAVRQKTVLKVDEAGTTAAAATAALVAPGAAPHESFAVLVDKPFIFALRDDRHGLILMIGYIGHPN